MTVDRKTGRELNARCMATDGPSVPVLSRSHRATAPIPPIPIAAGGKTQIASRWHSTNSEVTNSAAKIGPKVFLNPP